MVGCLFSFAAPDLISPRPSLPIVLQSTFISLHENCKRYPSKLEETSLSSCRRSVRSSQYRISSVLWSVAAKKISHLRIGVCFDSFFLSASDISNYCYRCCNSSKPNRLPILTCTIVPYWGSNSMFGSPSQTVSARLRHCCFVQVIHATKLKVSSCEARHGLGFFRLRRKPEDQTASNC